MVVRSDNGGEFFEGEFGRVCRKYCIKQEFTPAHSPEYNGVAERALGLIKDAALTSRIQAPTLYPGAPNYPSLWAEAIAWSCNALNCTSTTSNPEKKSPYEMWHGQPPPPGATYPILKPAVYKVKRTHKSEAKAQTCSYFGPGINTNRDCVRILNEERRAITTRNFTWQSVPVAPTAPPYPRGPRGAPLSREGASVAPSTTSAGMPDVAGGEDDRSSSSRGSGGSGNGSNSGSNSGSGSDSDSDSDSDSETDLPALRGPEARRLACFDKPAELTSRRTRENPRRNPRYASPPSPTSAEALLAPVARLPVSSTEEFTGWMLSAVLHVAEGLAARAVGELLFERAEEAHAARQEAEGYLLGAVDLMLNSPDAFETALASHELSESPIGKRPSDVEAPPMTVAGVAKSVYREGWEQAMREEFEGHLGTGTFSFVDGAPEGRRPVSSKWCFSWKTNKEGKINKFKARLVARRFSQIPNVDYSHSSSPCPSSACIELTLAVANEKGMNLDHWDVKQAHTHATLDEEAIAWACNNLNCTSTPSNPENKSPEEMWHGHPPPPGATYPFLKPAVFKVKRTHKSEPKAQKCFNNNRNYVRILNEKRPSDPNSQLHLAILTRCPHCPAPVAASHRRGGRGIRDWGGRGWEGASSQGGGRTEGEPVDGEPGFNLGTTAASGLAGPPARVATAAPPAAPQESGAGNVGDGAPSSREGASVASSTTSTGTADVGGGEDDRSSSRIRGSGGSDSDSSSAGSSGDDGGSDSGSGSDSETDLPALRGPEARRLARFDKPAELTSRRTRESPRRNPRHESPPSPTSAEALLASAASLSVSSTEEFTSLILSAVLHVAEGLQARTVRELLFERAEEAHAALQETEDFLPGAVDLMLNSPDAFETALASHELSESPIGKRPSHVEPPPMTVAGVVKCVYIEGWEQAMREEFEGVFSQIPNVDYFHSSSLCPSSASIKLMLAVANEMGMNLNHWDVKQAYTHATLDEEVFVRLPAGCGDKLHSVIKAEKAIYGLKQSDRQWGYHAADTLVENGFERCMADPCVFRKMFDEVVVMIIVIYVDDILVAGSDEDCKELLDSLNEKFPNENLGEYEWFGGCAIERDVEAGTLKISQTAYIDSMVKCFDVQSPSRIPASPNVDLGPKRDDEKLGEWSVREAIGSMMSARRTDSECRVEWIFFTADSFNLYSRVNNGLAMFCLWNRPEDGG
ncbi:unnamed protein product [Ectocarpus sp. CCAP 1310/34]|nr:unnamed protein product [Ectocarpus sp. CCAP 1310/34]